MGVWQRSQKHGVNAVKIVHLTLLAGVELPPYQLF